MRIVLSLLFSAFAINVLSQTPPPLETGVSHDLAKWRSERYSDIRYKLDLSLKKMSPVLNGTIEIKLKHTIVDCQECPPLYIVLDWRKIKGSEKLSAISNVMINGRTAVLDSAGQTSNASNENGALRYGERGDHLIFSEGVVAGENVIKLDFTSPILTSGSAITRYIDKEDGSEYIYSLFVPSDASTAFPVFDQPDLKARFELDVTFPNDWTVVANSPSEYTDVETYDFVEKRTTAPSPGNQRTIFEQTKPISTYVFAFAAGPWEKLADTGGNLSGSEGARELQSAITQDTLPNGRVSASKLELGDVSTGFREAPHVKNPVAIAPGSDIYVRRSQLAKFKPHAAEVFRLNREGIKFLEEYFDFAFPFPKYDLVLIPEFPFGGMEHAGATFLREDRVIFPQAPTKNDYVTRANVIFHEAAHQWFGDTVTMKWFDDLWLKEGFAEFMAYKTLDKVMPESGAWKIFYERNKQAAYLTDSTKGTTPIYQKIDNLSAAKSAYGNIVYRKAPSFLRQAEFYLGSEKFQAAVRSFLKKHEFANADWQDLVTEFEVASGRDLKQWAENWVKTRGMPIFRVKNEIDGCVETFSLKQTGTPDPNSTWQMRIEPLTIFGGRIKERRYDEPILIDKKTQIVASQNICNALEMPLAVFPNYKDLGYGVFLLDAKSRDHVLQNIGTEKDDFLRSMMWGSLWDSVREGELDPKVYVELVIKALSARSSDPGAASSSRKATGKVAAKSVMETDESTIQTLLSRVSTAMRYYIDTKPASSALNTQIESLLIDRMQYATTPGARITFYRAFLSIASSDNARRIMKEILKGGTGRVSTSTKDKFDIVGRLIVLRDPQAERLLAALEKTETSDEAKRYAYAVRAGFASEANKAKYWNDFVNNKDISESRIEAAIVPFNSIRQDGLTLKYLKDALSELPKLKRDRKIFFVNNWLGAFIGGQKSQEALEIVNKFLADNPEIDGDLRLKIYENSDLIERAVKIRSKY